MSPMSLIHAEMVAAATASPPGPAASVCPLPSVSSRDLFGRRPDLGLTQYFAQHNALSARAIVASAFEAPGLRDFETPKISSRPWRLPAAAIDLFVNLASASLHTLPHRSVLAHLRLETSLRRLFDSPVVVWC